MKTNFLMKASLMGLCLLASMEASAKDYYLAPGGTGNGMTIDKPFADPIKAFAALKAGDVLYVRGGTYHLSQTIKVNQTGTADKRNANGFKMGGCKQGGTSTGAHVFKNCIAAFHAKKGFDQNHHREGSYLINDLSFGNGINYGYNMEEPDYGNWVLRNCVGFAYGSQKMERNSAFTIAPDIDYCTWITLDHTNPMGEKASSNGTSYSKTIGNYASEYEDLSYETAIGDRQENGELPLKFGRSKAGSKLISSYGKNKNDVCSDKTNIVFIVSYAWGCFFSHTIV